MKAFDLVRENLKNFKAYDTSIMGEKILLNANENPYLASEDFESPYNRYPESQPKFLLHSLSKAYKAKEEQIVITSGGDQAIDLIIRCFINEGESVIITPPTFVMYQFYTEVQGGKVIKVPLMEQNNYQLNVAEIIKQQEITKAKVVFLVNPSAPLGHEIHKDDILYLLKALKDKAIVVVDEAYIEFSEVESFMSKIDEFDNLMIIRTLSKYYGFAGLRLGALIANHEIAEIIRAIMPPYSLSMPAIKVAEGVFGSEKLLSQAKENAGNILKTKKVLEDALELFPYVKKVFKTKTNYVFIIVDNGDDFKKHCFENEILVRSFESQIKGGVRISIGSDLENEILIRTMKNYKK
ncbi:MAG: Histidinol-phosphate aminotransferase [Alphaproteobacteria bacterium ADurb.Bin438]|nr:MAG: Histidinol-phosphate aminotransferase [Alphaproteobacteria bacterium ADurb.Bin438]